MGHVLASPPCLLVCILNSRYQMRTTRKGAAERPGQGSGLQVECVRTLLLHYCSRSTTDQLWLSSEEHLSSPPVAGPGVQAEHSCSLLRVTTSSKPGAGTVSHQRSAGEGLTPGSLHLLTGDQGLFSLSGYWRGITLSPHRLPACPTM